MDKDTTVVPLETGATKQEIVEKLEAAFEQIAAQLNVPVDKVRNIAERRHIQLEKRERQRREQTVRHLRAEGHSNEKIAEALGLSVRVIANIASKLIREGGLTPQRPGPKPLPDEERQEREEQVIRLRAEGHSNEKIAEALGLSVGIIIHIVSKLLAEGKVETQRAEAYWRNLADERVQTIIRMVKVRATLQEMGDALGCTKEWVRQVIGWMEDEHGQAIFTPDEALWTPQEAANELGVGANIISCLCRSGEIPTRRRGVNESGSYLITEEGMRALRVHPLVTRERKCVICDKTFVYEQGSGNRQVCSDSKCLEEYPRMRREKCLAQEPTIETLEGWRRALWQRLQSHKPPKKEKWLTLSGACELTGLSKMQVGWLGLRRIVTTSEHPTKRRHGRAVVGYAASEMEIARRVLAEPNL